MTDESLGQERDERRTAHAKCPEDDAEAHEDPHQRAGEPGDAGRGGDADEAGDGETQHRDEAADEQQVAGVE
ncbi:hypothetical protein ACOZ4I_13235 [Haloarcula salina]|uniref:hypothetical protein n=1 Tax=Haloarcula salina TaxID=1429914 RepID=UPI003C6EE727